MRGTLLGVAIGDALGMPVETWTRPYIMSLGDGRGITDFIDPTATRIKYAKPLEAGDTTDDWQLTEVVAESLIAKNGHFDLETLVEKHLEAFSQSTFGWGGTTKKALLELRDRKRPYNVRAPSYGPNTGLGNGIMMKVAPLAIANYRSRSTDGGQAKLWSEVMALARITHADDRAGIAAYIVAESILWSYDRAIKTLSDKEEFLQHLYDCAVYAESFDAPPDGWMDGFSDKISDVIRKVRNVWRYLKLESLRPLFNALSTLEFCLLVFLRYPRDFETGLCEIVNCGGDTDTQAAILGSIIGAQVGDVGIPRRWLTFRNKFDHVRSVADRLIAVCA
jgi:ADP-ribosylglycohydrolase